MNAQKLRGREGILFARIVLLFVPVLILLSSSLAQALENWDIYSDTDIIDGQYNLINIYDTPPDNTTVNMYGGSADFISTFEYSTLNIYGGSADLGSFENSIINISGGNIGHATSHNYAIVNFLGSDFTDSVGAEDFGTVNMVSGNVKRVIGQNSGVANLYGGIVSDYISAHNSSVIQIFGYDLVKVDYGGAYGDGQVYGFWMDTTPFIIDLRGADTFANLHLVPEPSTFILLTLGFLGIRGRKIMKLIKKNVGEASVTLRISLFFVLYTILFAATSQALAAWDIFHDTDIHSGTYGLIDIYDSPPDNTTVNFYGDLADYIGTHDSSTLNMYEGIADVRSLDNSTINIFGGTLSLAEAWNNGTVNFSGDASLNILEAWDFGTLNLTAGSLGIIGVSENGVLNITDGSAEEVWIHDSGVMHISGGIISDLLSAEDSSAVNVYGYDLVKTISGGKYGYGQVYGFWNDGTSFTIDLDDVGTYDHINLIPEPATFILFGVGSLVLLRKRNSKTNR